MDFGARRLRVRFPLNVPCHVFCDVNFLLCTTGVMKNGEKVTPLQRIAASVTGPNYCPDA